MAARGIHFLKVRIATAEAVNGDPVKTHTQTATIYKCNGQTLGLSAPLTITLNLLALILNPQPPTACGTTICHTFVVAVGFKAAAVKSLVHKIKLCLCLTT